MIINNPEETEYRQLQPEEANDNAEEASEIDSENSEGFTLDETLDMINGELDILSIRFAASGDEHIDTALQNYFSNQQYVQMASFITTLLCYYQHSDTNVKEVLAQLGDMLNYTINGLGLRSDPNYNDKCLRGVLSYFKWCFKDNKLTNSREMQDKIYQHFTGALNDKNYHKMYGMLIACQELYQQPEKSNVYDIVFDHIVALCPDLE